jgi:hypothetical protein
VTAEQVAAVASRYLSRERRTTGWFRPLERK